VTEPRLVLASASPRRRALLASLDLEFTVRPVDLDETPLDGEPPREYVLRLAREKAAARADAGELVLAADTVVVLGDGGADTDADAATETDAEILGKPADAADARRMLARIAGRTHSVYTGVALLQPAAGGGALRASAVATSRVHLVALSSEEIAWYVDTGEPMDKAGSYAIQGLGAMFVESVQGNYTNVVGLPLPTLYRLMAEMGHDLRSFRNGSRGS
jgi:septum formation protein